MQTMMIMTITTTMAAMTPGEIFFFFLVTFFVARVTRGEPLASERRDKPMRRAWLIMLIEVVACVMERMERTWRERRSKLDRSENLNQMTTRWVDMEEKQDIWPADGWRRVANGCQRPRIMGAVKRDRSLLKAPCIWPATIPVFSWRCAGGRVLKLMNDGVFESKDWQFDVQSCA